MGLAGYGYIAEKNSLKRICHTRVGARIKNNTGSYAIESIEKRVVPSARVLLFDQPPFEASLDQEFLVYNKKEKREEWLQLKDINKDDHYLLSKPVELEDNNLMLTPEDCYVLGYYIRYHGYVDKEYGVIRAGEFKFPLNPELVFALGICGENEATFIPMFILSLPKELLREFIKGYYFGLVKDTSKITFDNLKDYYMFMLIINKLYNRRINGINHNKIREPLMCTVHHQEKKGNFIKCPISNILKIGEETVIDIKLQDNEAYYYNSVFVR